jgi:hypothetical protein
MKYWKLLSIIAATLAGLTTVLLAIPKIMTEVVPIFMKRESVGIREIGAMTVPVIEAPTAQKTAPPVAQKSEPPAPQKYDAPIAPKNAPRAAEKEAKLQESNSREIKTYHYLVGLRPTGDNYLSLRRSPLIRDDNEIVRMGPDTLLTVVDRQGEWLYVRTLNGQMGWANGKYVACCRPYP